MSSNPRAANSSSTAAPSSPSSCSPTRSIACLRAPRPRCWSAWKSARSPPTAPRFPLDGYFTVFATENPVEFEGTYPLPEAQLDRFLLKIRVSYPSEAEERTILERHQALGEQGTGTSLEAVEIQSVDPALLAAARSTVQAVRVEPQLFDYLLALIRRTRNWPALSLGASPRAAVALLSVSKAIAARDGRSYLLPDDVKEAAIPVLRHRLQLKPEAELEGLDPDRVLADILAATAVPK